MPRVAFCLLFLAGHVAADIVSEFVWDTDDWKLEGDNATTLAHSPKMIKASDSGDKTDSTWFFVAPQKFLGDRKRALGGELQFRLGFFEFDAQGRGMLAGADVELRSERTGLTVVRQHLVGEWKFVEDVTVGLHESAGWSVKNMKRPPTRPEFSRLMGSLSSLKIRATYYAGREETYLGEVRMTEPGDDAPRKSSVKRQTVFHPDRVSPPSHAFTEALRKATEGAKVIKTIVGGTSAMAIVEVGGMEELVVTEADAEPRRVQVQRIESVSADEEDNSKVISALLTDAGTGAKRLQLGTIDAFDPEELQSFFVLLQDRATKARGTRKDEL